jgi:hypothetical protein
MTSSLYFQHSAHGRHEAISVEQYSVIGHTVVALQAVMRQICDPGQA